MEAVWSVDVGVAAVAVGSVAVGSVVAAAMGAGGGSFSQNILQAASELAARTTEIKVRVLRMGSPPV